MRAGCVSSRLLSLALLMLAGFTCFAAEPPFHVEQRGDLVDLYDLKTGKQIADRVRQVMWMDSYWKFTREGRHGIIDDTGRLVAAAVYDEIGRSRKSAFYIVARDDRYGVIDLEGRERVPLKYDMIDQSLAQAVPWVVKLGGREGLMDPADQHLLLPVRYENIVLRGAFVLATNPENTGSPRYQAFDLRGRPVPGAESDAEIVGWGEDRLILDAERVIGADGRLVVAPGEYTSVRQSSDMRAIIFDKAQGKAGVIDRDGRWVVQPEWDYIETLGGFSHGWMRVVTGGMPNAGGKVGVIDMAGQIILQPRWEGVDLHDAKTAMPFFQVERDGQVWFLDLHDEPLFEAPFDAVHRIDRGGTYLVERDGKTGLCIDVADARCPIPVEYDQLVGFDQAPSGLWIAQKEGRLGVLQQTDGHVVVPLDYDFLQMSPESTGLPSLRETVREVTIVARKRSLNGTLLLRADGQGNWKLAAEKLDARPADWQARAAQAACAALPAFERDQADADLKALMLRWRAGLPERESAPFGMPWPALAGSVANHSRAQQFIVALFLRPWQLLNQPREADTYELGELFARMLETATPVRSGGRYPEPEAEFAGLCAEVWYLRIPALEQSADPLLAGGYALPPAGTLERDVYPFVTVARTPDGLRLAGVSSELVQVLGWYYTSMPMAGVEAVDLE
ncbi:WG repeat-containing protein [Luteimonas sp. A537]